MSKTIEFPQSIDYHIKQLEKATDKVIVDISNIPEDENVVRLHKFTKIDWDSFRKMTRPQQIITLEKIIEIINDSISSFTELRDTVIKIKDRL